MQDLSHKIILTLTSYQVCTLLGCTWDGIQQLLDFTTCYNTLVEVFHYACKRELNLTVKYKNDLSGQSPLFSLFILQWIKLVFVRFCTKKKSIRVKKKWFSIIQKYWIHLPLWTLVLGTAPCRNSCLLLTKMSCWFEMTATPSRSCMLCKVCEVAIATNLQI